jgi:hypothetical protein
MVLTTWVGGYRALEKLRSDGKIKAFGAAFVAAIRQLKRNMRGNYPCFLTVSLEI